MLNLDLIQKSANEETKSSAGDKYETGRAMLMLEKEKFVGQKEQLFNQLQPLKSIDPKKTLQLKLNWALLYPLLNATYFIAAGIGEVNRLKMRRFWSYQRWHQLHKKC